MHISCKGGVRPCSSRGGAVKCHKRQVHTSAVTTTNLQLLQFLRVVIFSCTSITQTDNYLYVGNKAQSILIFHLSQRKARETPKAVASLQLWADCSIFTSVRLDVPRAGGLLHTGWVVLLCGGYKPLWQWLHWRAWVCSYSHSCFPARNAGILAGNLHLRKEDWHQEGISGNEEIIFPVYSWCCRQLL